MKLFIDAWASTLSPATRRIYVATIRKLDVDLVDADANAVERALRDLCVGLAPSTARIHYAAVASLCGWLAHQGHRPDDPTDGLARPRQIRTPERVYRLQMIPKAEFERLLRRAQPRERALWRMLVDTGARPDEVLGLDWSDVDLKDRSAVVRSRSGKQRQVRWTVGCSRLLRAIAPDHGSGPVFVNDRPSPAGTVVAGKLGPDGPTRMSQRRAEQTLRRASDGQWTLRHLRHMGLRYVRLTEQLD